MPVNLDQQLKSERKVLESLIFSHERAVACGRPREAQLFLDLAQRSLALLLNLSKSRATLPEEFAATLASLSVKVQKMLQMIGVADPTDTELRAA